MKGVLSFIDLVALEHEFQKLVGGRLQQVYDAGPKHTYLLKISHHTDQEAGTTATKTTSWLLIQPGKIVLPTRNPTTERRMIPTSFCGKLRRHLANRRITEISHFRHDRILRFYFGEGETRCVLVVELYGEGNLSLCNAEGNLLQFIHPHRFGDQRLRVGKPHLVWNLEPRGGPWNLETAIRNALCGVDLEDKEAVTRRVGVDMWQAFQMGRWADVTDQETLTHIIDDIGEGRGYLVTNTSLADPRWKQCVPVRYSYLDPIYVFEEATFGEALERYLVPDKSTANIKPDVETVQEKTQAAYVVAERRRRNLERAHSQKVSKLQSQIASLERDIDTVTEDSQKVIQLLNTQGVEGTRGQEHLFTVVLGDSQSIELQAGTSYYANLDRLHGLRRNREDKLRKTEAGLEKATASLLAKTKREGHQGDKKMGGEEKHTLDRSGWFQAHHWFMTSGGSKGEPGLLAICGRNAEGSETLVKRHMESRDLYFHSEAAGSGSCILKNPDGREVTPVECEEVGAVVVMHSQTWKMSVADRAYWVLPEQVSKTAPTGEFVQRGAFIVRGRRNYMVARPLEVGISLWEGRLHVTPFFRVAKLPSTERVKAKPGKGRRQAQLLKILRHLGVVVTDRDWVDARVPRPIRLV